ncbi:MAG: T9SS type A sorting domain-containing protein [Ferruginibacter sp.]
MKKILILLITICGFYTAFSQSCHVTITSSGPLTFCGGGSVTLTATMVDSMPLKTTANNHLLSASAPMPQLTYAWSNGATTQSITVTQSGMYSVTVSNQTSGCTATSVVMVNANASTNTGIIMGDTTVCRGRTIQFTAMMPGGTWSSSNISAVGTINQNGLFTTGTRAGTTKIMYIATNMNGCSDTASKWITIFDRADAGTINGDASVCMGGSIHFTATGVGGVWSSSNISAVGTINQNGWFSTGTNAGTTKIMYVVTNANGCTDTAFKWITIYNKPFAGTLTGNTTVCRGRTLQFTTTGTGGVWASSNISAVGTIDQNGLFTTGTRAGTTKIMYIVSNANDCKDTASQWITILDSADAGTVNGDNTVCMGGTIQFTTTGTGGVWSSSNISAVGTISQNGLFTTGTNAGTTKIMYVVTNANGCTDTAFKWITIYNKPFAGTVTGNTTVCRGRTIQFTTTGTGGTWASSNISAVGTIDQNGLFTTGTRAGTTKIMYIVGNANGCKDTASQWITILERAHAGTISGDNTVCIGGIIQFSSTGTGGVWSSSNISAVGTINQNGLFSTGTNAGTTKIMYVVTNANGCSDTTFKWITIYNRPFAGNITGNTTVCRGRNIQFTTTGTGGTWASSNISAIGTIDQNGLFTTGTRAGTTKIMYIVSNANGCKDTASQWITILDRAHAGTITGNNTVCQGGTIQFTTTGMSGVWSSSNISAVGTINQNGLFSTGTNAGTTKIMYIATNPNGCSDTASKWITITPPCLIASHTITQVSIGKNMGSLEINVSPNPTKDRFTLNIKSQNNEPIEIFAIAQNGNIAYRKIAKSQQQSFSFGEQLLPGIYLIEVRQGKFSKTVTAIKL